MFCFESGTDESVTDKFVDQPEEDAANLDEYYDPEDIDQVSISPTFYEQLLHMQIPIAKK